LGQPACDLGVSVGRKPAPLYIGSGGADAEHVGAVLLVGYEQVYIFAQPAHDLARLFPSPQLFTVVEIAGDGYPLFLCRLAGIENYIRQFAAERRGYTGEMEPVRPVEYLLPVEIRARCGRKGRAGTV